MPVLVPVETSTVWRPLPLRTPATPMNTPRAGSEPVNTGPSANNASYPPNVSNIGLGVLSLPPEHSRLDSTLLQLRAPPGTQVFETSALPKRQQIAASGLWPGVLSRQSGTCHSHHHRALSPTSSHQLQSQHNRQQLSHSMHVPDAACCGYRGMAAHRTGVKGLFVTYCQNDVEVQLVRAVRDLDIEKESHERSQNAHRVQLGNLMSKLNAMTEERDTLQRRLNSCDEEHAKELKEMRILKEEYERRWREEVDNGNALRKQAADATTEAEKQRNELGGKNFDVIEMQSQVKAAKEALARMERESVDSTKRNGVVFDEKMLLTKKCADMEAEMKRNLETISTKTAIIAGLEKELQKAQDKLSSVAFFREAFSGAKKRNALRPVSAGSPSRGPTSSDRLYQRYFGRL